MVRINEYVPASVVHVLDGVEHIQALAGTSIEKLSVGETEIYYIKDEGRNNNLPIQALGTAHVRSFGDGEVHGGNQSVLYMHRFSRAVAHQLATVHLSDHASGVFHGKVKGHARDNANCDAYKESTATLSGSASCRAHDTATLYLHAQSAGACYGASNCVAHDRAVVLCYGQSVVRLYGRAHCYAYDDCKVFIYSKTAVAVARSPRAQLAYISNDDVKVLPLPDPQSVLISQLLSAFQALFTICLASTLVYRIVRFLTTGR